jgi:hypothetical protein
MDFDLLFLREGFYCKAPLCGFADDGSGRFSGAVTHAMRFLLLLGRMPSISLYLATVRRAI